MRRCGCGCEWWWQGQTVIDGVPGILDPKAAALQGEIAAARSAIAAEPPSSDNRLALDALDSAAEAADGLRAAVAALVAPNGALAAAKDSLAAATADVDAQLDSVGGTVVEQSGGGLVVALRWARGGGLCLGDGGLRCESSVVVVVR
jgi:hypothetical protein